MVYRDSYALGNDIEIRLIWAVFNNSLTSIGLIVPDIADNTTDETGGLYIDGSTEMAVSVNSTALGICLVTCNSSKVSSTGLSFLSICDLNDNVLESSSVRPGCNATMTVNLFCFCEHGPFYSKVFDNARIRNRVE